jgi:hypothetical protein
MNPESPIQKTGQKRFLAHFCWFDQFEPETTGAVPQHESASSDSNRIRNRLPQENTNLKKLPPEGKHVFEPSFSTPTGFFTNYERGFQSPKLPTKTSPLIRRTLRL